MTILKKGSKGTEVRTLQSLLINRGYNLVVDGVFGGITEEVVKEFQKKNRLTPDGIVGPKTWEALNKAEVNVQFIRKIDKVILHCAATPEGKDYTVADIDRWHKARGFKKIGYHYVIYRDGSVHQGRPESEIGAHTANYNAHSIGICYIGGMDARGVKAKDTRTPQQKEALVKLVKEILKKYNLTLNNVYGHYQFANKACPSFKIETFKQECK